MEHKIECEQNEMLETRSERGNKKIVNVSVFKRIINK